MKIGDLNYSIVLRRNTPGAKNAVGEAVAVWANLAAVWAKFTPTSDAERLASSKVDAMITARFVIRFSNVVSDLNPKDRLVHDGREYNIVGVKITDRRQWIEISAATRTDG